MFQKVLIAEDHESANISIQKSLSELDTTQIDYVYYCDDALMRIRKAMAEESPYELLITDLSFEEDHRMQVITDGLQLIKAAREIQPDLKILVFTSESKTAVIDTLINHLHVNAYVRKARHDAKELKQAFIAIKEGNKYLNKEIRQSINNKNSYDFTEYDVMLLTLLAQGIQQKDFSKILQENNVSPSSLSSIEKRINKMKDQLSFKTNEQLIAFTKDLGII